MELLIICIVIAYAVILLHFYKASKKDCINIADVVQSSGQLSILNERHTGSLVAMCIPVLLVGAQNNDWLQLRFTPEIHVAALTFILGIAAFIIALFTAIKTIKKGVPAHFGQEKMEKYIFIRTIFLVVYEIFFRAVLLQVSLQFVPVPIAVAINVILYVGAHAFSTRQEFWGSLPFGVLLCWLTLFSGSVWPAVLVHALLALPYDLVLLSTAKPITKTIPS